MKSIIVLIAIITFALGNICKEEFNTVRKARSNFFGFHNYKSKYASSEDEFIESNFAELRKFQIESIKNGIIEFFEGEILNEKQPLEIELYKRPKYYYSSKIICSDVNFYNVKTCLIEYISIEDQIFLVRQVEFKYMLQEGIINKGESYTEYITHEPNKEEDECQRKINNFLKAGLTCKIENIEKAYQIFHIPITNPKGYLKFNTGPAPGWIVDELYPESMNLKLYIDSDNKLAVLKKGEEALDKFEEGACYYLLEKIYEILEFTPRKFAEEGLYYFRRTHVKPNDVRIPANKDIPRQGIIKVDHSPNIKILPEQSLPEKPFEFQSLMHGDIITPIYEGYIYKLIYTEINEGNKYNFWVKLNSLASVIGLKKLLSGNKRFSSITGDVQLTYYKEANLQSKDKAQIDFDRPRILDFHGLQNYVYEINDKGETLKTIVIYDMSLIEDNDQEWLFIKGEDQSLEAVNKKYLVNIKSPYDSYTQESFKKFEIKLEEFHLEYQRLHQSVLYYQDNIGGSIITGKISYNVGSGKFQLGNFKSTKPCWIEKNGNTLNFYKKPKTSKELEPYKTLKFGCQKCLDILIDMYNSDLTKIEGKNAMAGLPERNIKKAKKEPLKANAKEKPGEILDIEQYKDEKSISLRKQERKNKSESVISGLKNENVDTKARSPRLEIKLTKPEKPKKAKTIKVNSEEQNKINTPQIANNDIKIIKNYKSEKEKEIKTPQSPKNTKKNKEKRQLTSVRTGEVPQ
jgi:hypothetical protein